MTAQELIQKTSHEVRRDSDLMALYIKLFAEHFGKEPDCAGCTFKNDWKRFTQAVSSGRRESQIQNVSIMSKKSFELKRAPGKIYTYKDDKGRPVRSYARNMTEEFAVNFLTKGTAEQIEERKKLFTKLPEMEVVEQSLEKMKRKELDALAKEKGLTPSDYKSKAEVIEAIQNTQEENTEEVEDSQEGDTEENEATE